MNDTSNDHANEDSTEVKPTTFLEPGGRLDTKLQDTASATMEITSARQLHQQLCRDADRLRNADQSFGAEPVGDAVLRFCVASAGDGRPTDELRAAARRAYQQHPDDYDAVLGDLIPAEFCHQAREILARRNYFSNNNATAAADWPVFMATLEQSTRKELRGLPTGLPNLDGKLGGLHGLMFLGGDTAA